MMALGGHSDFHGVLADEVRGFRNMRILQVFLLYKKANTFGSLQTYMKEMSITNLR